jgi:ATP-dependent Clp protease protease subunit
MKDRIYNRLLEERIVFMSGEVRDDMANMVCAQLLLLSSLDAKKDIFMYINSPGGSVTAGMAIYDTMELIPNDVATVTFGMAASMGQFLLTSGAKGKRYATNSSRILMHQPLGGIGGTAIDIRIQAEDVQITEIELTEYLVRTSQRYGMAPQQFAEELQKAGQIQQLVAEVTRAKALASVLGRITVKDASGKVIDLEDLAPKTANPADLVEEA